MIDDVQFLVSKRATLDELMYTIDFAAGTRQAGGAHVRLQSAGIAKRQRRTGERGFPAAWPFRSSCPTSPRGRLVRQFVARDAPGD